jgi:hypothetical protein|tara:strand:- start:1006 stop:1572 length:567 start_codon:yes stop_codon:yes gene_type:complete
MSARKKLSRHTQGAALNKVHSGPLKPEDNKVLLVADWLRNEKRSGLKTKEAVQYEKRVEYFKGSKLVDSLLSPKFKGPAAKQNPVKSRAEAGKIGQELLRLGYIHRSQRVSHAHTRRWELELLSGPFEEEGLYTWVYEGGSHIAFFPDVTPLSPPCINECFLHLHEQAPRRSSTCSAAACCWARLRCV